jgi:hypothetical protein
MQGPDDEGGTDPKPHPTLKINKPHRLTTTPYADERTAGNADGAFAAIRAASPVTLAAFALHRVAP